MDLQIDLCVGAMVIKKTSKFPPPWNFTLTFECTMVGRYQNSHPHGTSNSPLSVYNGRKKIWKKCTPMELQIDLGVCAMFRRYQNSHPHGTSNWPWVCTMVRRYQNFHPRGTSNWPWVCTMVRRYKKSHPRGTSDNLWVCTMVRRYQNSHVQW